MLALFLFLLTISKCIACPEGCECSREGILKRVYCPPWSVTAEAEIGFLWTPGKDISIDCYTNDSTVYRWLEGIDQIQTIKITNCPLPPANVTIFTPMVKTLMLKYGNYSHFINKDFFKNLVNLEKLEISGSRLTDLPDDTFNSLSNLTELILWNNKLTKIPKFTSSNNLTSLFLSTNDIHDVNFDNSNLTILNVLSLYDNLHLNLTRHSFKNLPNLKSLDMRNCNLKTLPSGIFQYNQELEYLSLSANKFIALPDDLIVGLSRLRKFQLFSNRIPLKTLPSRFFANLTSLEHVDLHDCYIENIPYDCLLGTENLKEFLANKNQLETLPEELFKDVTKLKKLDLSYNKLMFLPEYFLLSTSQLSDLNLMFNELTEIPKDLLTGLLQLKTLNLKHNRLNFVHIDAFNGCPKIEELNMAYNNISKFKTFMGRSPFHPLTSLRNLDLSNNFLSDSFDDWRIIMLKLSNLNLSHNSFKSVEVHYFSYIQDNITIDLSWNNISRIDFQGYEALMKENNDGSMTMILEHNHFDCSCWAYDLLRYLEKKMHPSAYRVKLQLGNQQCVSPKYLEGTSINQLPERTFECDWDELSKDDIYNGCSYMKRMYDLTLIMNCERLNLTSLPETLPNSTKINKIHVNAAFNRISNFPKNFSSEYNKVAKLDLSHNAIEELSQSSLPPNLQVLLLDNNNLKFLDDGVLNSLNHIQNLTLYGNPWLCSCKALNFLQFVQNSYKKIYLYNNITCSTGEHVSSLTTDDLCSFEKNVIITSSITVAVLGIILGLTAAAFYRFNQEIKIWLYAHNWCLWFVTEDELDKDKLYDAFISFSHKDEDFVMETLVPALEQGPTPFKLCIHHRDWIPGEFITTNIINSVESSRRTLVVLSPSFLDSVWGKLEFRTAHTQALSEKRARVIIIFYGDVGSIDKLDDELQAYIKINTYLKWGDPWFWDKLNFALPHRKVQQHNRKIVSQKSFCDEKLELSFPSSPIELTPPTDIITNPLDEKTKYQNGNLKTILTT